MRWSATRLADHVTRLRLRVASGSVVWQGVGFLYSSLPAPEGRALNSLGTMARALSSRQAVQATKPAATKAPPPGRPERHPAGCRQIGPDDVSEFLTQAVLKLDKLAKDARGRSTAPQGLL